MHLWQHGRNGCKKDLIILGSAKNIETEKTKWKWLIPPWCIAQINPPRRSDGRGSKGGSCRMSVFFFLALVFKIKASGDMRFGSGVGSSIVICSPSLFSEIDVSFKLQSNVLTCNWGLSFSFNCNGDTFLILRDLPNS